MSKPETTTKTQNWRSLLVYIVLMSVKFKKLVQYILYIRTYILLSNYNIYFGSRQNPEKWPWTRKLWPWEVLK
jgi:hypothetical protein